MRSMVQLLTTDDVAKRLRVSRRAAFMLVKQPGFPAPVRLGSRMVRYRESDLDAWVAAHVAEGEKG
jgi:excisionase family DNA binding protein